MDMQYLPFCFADRHFYDQPRVSRTGSGHRKYVLPSSDVWADWTQRTSDGWLHVHPPAAELPEQGWKIHVSATLDNAQHILDEVAGYCAEHTVPFKFLPTNADVLRANGKYASRSGSGKFITIYPPDDAGSERIAADLDALVGGQEGPYILSDVRYRQGPVYLRYGGFHPMFVRGDQDELVPAVRHPDGDLVPDERLPAFRPPSWVDVPGFVQEQVEALGGTGRPEDFPYEVTHGLHFSNGGGIYQATSTRTGQTVVLKEARPHTGLGTDGRDAVDRLERELSFLRELADLETVVDVQEVFDCGGHRFLVEEFVPGATLNREVVLRNPLIKAGVTHADRIAYRDWALGVLEQVSESLRSFHDRGIVFGDLHPNNVMITPEGRVRFIDFEMAYRTGETDIAPAGAPGFVAEDGRTGTAADRYSLGCMKLSLFLPLTVLLPLDPSTLRSMVEHATEIFDLPDDLVRNIVRDLALPEQEELASRQTLRTRRLRDEWPVDDLDGLQAVEDAITRGLDETLDLSRSDRVYPGDILQFHEGGFGIASGACGVLLAHPEAHRRKDVLDWVEHAASQLQRPAYGFYDGLAGAAWTLDHFGRRDRAHELLGQLLKEDLSELPSDLYSGLAGIGIMLMDWEEGGSLLPFADSHRQIRAIMTDRLDEHRAAPDRGDGAGPVAAVGRGGLMRGMTGQALYWIRSFERTGHHDDLRRARQALDVDLSTLVHAEDGSVQLNEGFRILPYLASGSTGVGLGIHRYLQHAEDPELEDTLAGIAHNLDPTFCVQSTLVNGRAGFVYYALRTGSSSTTTTSGVEEAVRQARLLRAHGVVRGTSITFPGEQLMRLSSDWASGAAGVLASLRTLRAALSGSTHELFRLPVLGVDPLDGRPSSQRAQPTVETAA